MPDPHDELSSIFPPKWKRGDRWRVSMSTRSERAELAGKIRYQDLVFEMRVAEVPATDAGLYRIDISTDDDGFPIRARAYYRKRPFSFQHIESIDEKGERTSSDEYGEEQDGRPLPVSGSLDRFWFDFPVMPDPPRLGETQFTRRNENRVIYTVERHEDTLRFTRREGRSTVSVIEWKRGAPWWTTLARTAGSFSVKTREFEDAFDGSGRLLDK
jgi:hypothetical protein